MKKALMLLICLVTIGMFSVSAFELPEEVDSKVVTIYIFRGSGCSHCYDALEYFNDTLEENPELKKYIDVEVLETWYDENNYEVSEKVAKTLGDELSGVPYIVVGNAYHKAGFGKSIGDDIIEAALEEYKNTKYVDIVAKTINNFSFSPNIETLREACISEGIIDGDLDDDNDYYIDDPSVEDIYVDPSIDINDEEFDIDPENEIALGIVTILLVISAIINCVTLPLSIVFIILFIKEKKKNKKEN